MFRIQAQSALLAMTAAAAATAQVAVESPNLTRNAAFADVNDDGDFGDEWGVFGAAAVNFTFFGDEVPFIPNPLPGSPNNNSDDNPGHATLFGDRPGNDGGVFQTGIPAVPGETYEITIRIQWEENWDARTRFGLEFFAADDSTLLSAFVDEIVDERVGEGYQRFDLSATAPAFTAFVRPIILFDQVNVPNNPTSGAAATVDNVQVRVADESLSLNPGFQDFTGFGTLGDFWETFGAAALDLDFFNNGNPGHATLFGDNAGNNGGLFQKAIPAEQGETYTFTVDLSFEDNWDAETFLRLEFFGADDGTDLGNAAEVEVIEQPGAGYRTYQVTATAPNFSFVEFVRPVLLFQNAIGGADELEAMTADNGIVQTTASLRCNEADIAGLLGVLDFYDLVQLTDLIEAGSSEADIFAPFTGSADAADITAFVNALAQGCS
ncbi:MAG: hypothetical protein AAF747_00130 [Planctomycetota bacterium]